MDFGLGVLHRALGIHAVAVTLLLRFSSLVCLSSDLDKGG